MTKYIYRNRIHCGRLHDAILLNASDPLCHLYILGGCNSTLFVVGQVSGANYTDICGDVKALYTDRKMFDRSYSSDAFNDRYMRLSLDALDGISHRAKDMIEDCQFEGNPWHPLCKKLMNGVDKFHR